MKVVDLLVLLFFMLLLPVSVNAQVNEDFEVVFGQFAGDGGEPVDGWFGALLSNQFGPTGIIPGCLLYTSPSPRDQRGSRMPSSA